MCELFKWEGGWCFVMYYHHYERKKPESEAGNYQWQGNLWRINLTAMCSSPLSVCVQSKKVFTVHVRL